MAQFIPGKELEVEYNGAGKISLYVDMAIGIGGDKWPAAELFCNFITDRRWRSFFQATFSGKSCLELGSGNGLVGILLEKAFQPSSVVITDLESHMDHIEKNICRNDLGKTTCRALDWFNPYTDESSAGGAGGKGEGEDQFDCIFALECVYREDLFQPLITTLIAKSHEKTVIFLGITRQFATSAEGPLFFDLLTENGYFYKKIPFESVVPDADPNPNLNPNPNPTNGTDLLIGARDLSSDANIGIFVVYR